jgi:hypothetical protein
MGSDPAIFHGIEEKFSDYKLKKRTKYKNDGAVYQKPASGRRRMLP